MATRYDGTDVNTLDLEIANTPSTALARFASLAMLLRWNDEHPPGAEERQRNQAIYANWQHNRNPFIDHPEYISLIWGNVRLEKLTAAVVESGATDAYTMTLGSQPAADVIVTLSVTSASQISVSPASLTFTAANWNQPQTVTISAVNDTVHEPTLTARVQHAVASADPRYAALIPLEVTVTVTDDDPVISPTPLPITYGGPWDTLPTGFLGAGLGSPYAGSLGGDAGAGSAKFDSTGDQLTIGLSSAPATLSYQLKGNPSAGTATGGTFLVQQSADGVNFTTLRTVTNKDNTDQAFIDPLALTTRYVSFSYADKTSGNIQLDKLAITAAPQYLAWASSFGLSGADASAQNDYEHDGFVNLLDYALGGSPLANDRATIQPAVQPIAGNLRLTAIVRTSDAALVVVAETSTDIANAASWTTAGITTVPSVDQTGVPGGFTRVAYNVPGTGGPRFLHLRFTLN